MKKLRTAIFGTGFMGRVHTEALRRLGNVEVAGVAARTENQARRFAEENRIERATGNYVDFLDDPEIDAVHICTPNPLHFRMAMDALGAGKHVVCEKPLATSVAEGEQLVSLAREKGLANCTLYNLRFYPQVQNMREICRVGELGDILAVQGTYSQDWLLNKEDWNWRVEEGPSRAFADIGTHWCDMVEHVTGQRFTAVCADLATFHQERLRPRGSHETFSRGSRGGRADQEWVSVTTEDFGSVIFRLGERARGAVTVSQIAAGRKNRLFLEIFGTKSSLAWDAENPDELWRGRKNEPSQLVAKGNYADLPDGHSEGYDTTFKYAFRRFYRAVEGEENSNPFPAFEAGLRQLQIVDAVLESSRKQMWVRVPGPTQGS